MVYPLNFYFLFMFMTFHTDSIILSPKYIMTIAVFGALFSQRMHSKWRCFLHDVIKLVKEKFKVDISQVLFSSHYPFLYSNHNGALRAATTKTFQVINLS